MEARQPSPGVLDKYKNWVRRHPGIVQNLDWLLYLTVWNPARTSAHAGPSEVQYEAYHACIGLLSVWHQHLTEEDELPVKKPAAALWLELLEQVEVIIELRAMHMESLGKMSRYGPMVTLEAVKSLLKMLMWSQYSGHLYLRHPSPEDIAQFEAEQGFQDVLSALERLRARYTSLSDCSTAATSDVLSQLSTAVAPLRGAARAAQRWLGLAAREQGSSAAGGSSKQRSCSGAGASSACVSSADVSGTNVSGANVSGAHVSGANVSGGGVSRGWWGGGANVSGANVSGGGVGVGVEGSVLSRSQPGQACGSGSGVEGTQLRETSMGRLRVPGVDEGGRQGLAAWEVEAWQRSNLGEGEGLSQGHHHHHHQQQQQQQQQQQGLTAPLQHVFSDEHAGMNLIWLGEMLHIWRPLIYVWMLYRYGRRSWRPWWTSLAVDLLSGHFSRRGRLLLQRSASCIDAGPSKGQSAGKKGNLASRPPPPTSLLSVALVRGLSSHQWSLGERRELSERRRKLAMYLLRSPFFNSFVKPPTESIQRRTAHLPLVGACTDYVSGLLDTFTKYYSYTSASS